MHDHVESPITEASSILPVVRVVPWLACLSWLSQEWADLRAAWPVSLAHGALFALAAFARSAIALPIIVDRQTDPVSALLTSLSAVRRNPVAMLIWAGAIVVLVGIGALTTMIGLVVIFPLLGPATWHASRALTAPV